VARRLGGGGDGTCCIVALLVQNCQRKAVGDDNYDLSACVFMSAERAINFTKVARPLM
jgi:hypothetical protein